MDLRRLKLPMVGLQIRLQAIPPARRSTSCTEWLLQFRLNIRDACFEMAGNDVNHSRRTSCCEGFSGSIGICWIFPLVGVVFGAGCSIDAFC